MATKTRKETKAERIARESAEAQVRRAAWEAECAAEAAADKAFRLRDNVTAPDGIVYFVSTINRESSALACYNALYAETMVWALDAEGNRIRGIVWQGEACKSSSRSHDYAVTLLREKGPAGLNPPESDEDAP